MKNGAKKVVEIVGTIIATASLTLDAYCEYKKAKKKLKKHKRTIKKETKGGYYYDGPEF